MSCELQNTEKNTDLVDIPYNHCLNCGSELKGSYCHNCGQRATNTNPTVRKVVMEYIYNAFFWDPKIFRTLWLLISRPGLLTKEFLSGRYVSYMHPLKLNLFILFVFVTLFVLFSGTEKINHVITKDGMLSSLIQINQLTEDPEYVESLLSSPRDTIQLSAPLLLAKEHPQIITNIRTVEDTQQESLDKWTAVIPHRLIEDGIVVPGADGYYTFNTIGETRENIDLLNSVWNSMVKFTTRYFPIIVLLTAPFLSFSLRLVQRRKKQTRVNRFVFSLHYTAFLEFSIVFIYLLHLFVEPPVGVMQWLLIIASCTYLTLAFHRVYEELSWGKAITKAIYASLVYLLIILFAFLCLVFVAIVNVALQS